LYNVTSIILKLFWEIASKLNLLEIFQNKIFETLEVSNVVLTGNIMSKKVAGIQKAILSLTKEPIRQFSLSRNNVG
jgi:hypothetical protein